MDKIKTSAVSYLNAKPFIEGLRQTGLLNEMDLSLEIPSKTAMRLLHGDVQLGLVPVAVIPQLPQAHIVSNYCIGAVGEVKTVCLYSQVPLSDIQCILLDYHSRTSVNLVRILCQKYWHISPEFVSAELGFEANIAKTTAGVIIGDRTIEWGKKFEYAYDLSGEWFRFSGLPFVFAAWVSTKPLPNVFIDKLNDAFAAGMTAIPKIAQEYRTIYDPSFDIEEYLTKYISYSFDDKKRQGLQQFFEYMKMAFAAI